MRIRPLQRADYPEIKSMLIDFGRETGLAAFDQDQYDHSHAEQILLRCEYSGASLVAQADGEIAGMLLALREQDLWIRKIVRMRELAWWIRPLYRGSSVGGRLWTSYIDRCEDLKLRRQISGYTVTRLSTSPEFDYERRGFRFIEATYMIGE
jgi:N-acetylglutamate synthase-like GNAT family acetyltransferase